MIVECVICGSYADLERFPTNNICPVCLTVGSLWERKRLSDEEISELLEEQEGENG